MGLDQLERGAIIDIMEMKKRGNQLIVRNLEEEVVRELKLRAARHGRSAEAEHREILRQALLPAEKRKPFKDLLLAMPQVGDDADFERASDRGRDVEL
jgi:plasmid stability protein